MRRAILNRSEVMQGIGITATSTVIEKKLLQHGLPRFARWGMPCHVSDRIYQKFLSFAGTDESRALSLCELWENPLVGAIWCARGGYGMTRILPLLDKWKVAEKIFRPRPKLVLGFSDVTALHFYLQEKCAIPSVHAPMPAGTKWMKMPPRVDQILQSIFKGKMGLGKKSHSMQWNTKFIGTKANVEGILTGGNLTLLVNLIGTPWQPNLKGKILFLEDCAEAPYRIDRMLVHLENAGMLRGLNAVVLGDFEADVKYRDSQEKKMWKSVFSRFHDLGIPTLYNAPVGHGKRNEPLPLGVRAAFSGSKLIFLDQPVRDK